MSGTRSSRRTAGDVAAIKALIQGEPGLVARKDKYGVTPLQAAARGDYKAMSNSFSPTGRRQCKGQQFATPLHWAAYGGYNSTGSVAPCQWRGRQAIAAVGSRNYAVAGPQGRCGIPLANGADLDASSYEGKTLLHDAGSKEMAEFLLARGSKSCQDYGAKRRCTALHFRGKEVAGVSSGQRADVNARDDRAARR